MADIKIQISNESSVLTDNQVQAIVPVLQTQVSRDFGPKWGIDADLEFVTKDKLDPNKWWLIIFDDSDQPGALGYHDLNPSGFPLGNVFAKTDIQDGLQWTVTTSHELLEMLADPDINLTALIQSDQQTATLYAYEVCDAVEADQFGYDIDDILVSDFVYPSYFESMFYNKAAVKFDHQNKLKNIVPDMLPGGYMLVWDIYSGSGWHQIFADRPSYITGMRRSRPRIGSRRERKMTTRNQWMKSEIKDSKVDPDKIIDIK
jgi:hypothetical protein